MKVLKLFYLIVFISSFNITGMAPLTDEAIKTSINAIIQKSETFWAINGNSHLYLLNGCSYFPGSTFLEGNSFAQPFLDWINMHVEKGKALCSNPTANKNLYIMIVADERIYLSMGTNEMTISVGALKKLSLRELMLAIAHELGHFVYEHLSKRDKFDSSILNILRTYNTRSLVWRWNVLSKYPSYIQYPTRLIIGPIDMCSQLIYSLVSNIHIKKQEREADEFAAQLIPDEDALKGFLVKMSQDYFSTYKARIVYELSAVLGLEEHPHFKKRFMYMQKIMREQQKRN